MRVVTIDEEALPACARLFVAVFNGPPWNEDWQYETVLLRLSEFQRSAGFFGLMAVDSEELVGFVLGNAE
ncbi:MAG: hypothetical protein EOP21_14485, partial [Hyphomicrobiales bacterium]